MYRLPDYGSMLGDRRRVKAYSRALSAAISEASVVLDLGAGLGTFSILAARAGAARVYAVDPADVIAVAEQLARANGVADRITFIQSTATALALPEQPTVIVSDLASALPLFRENIPSLIHVRDRFLAPGGTLIPQRDRLLCAPVSNAGLYASLLAPWTPAEGIDLRIAETMALNVAYACTVVPGDLAAEAVAWAELDYRTITSPDAGGSAEWTLAAPATIHGVALWFESTLHGDIRYSSGPEHPDSVHATLVLPLLAPVAIAQGGRFTVRLQATLTAGRYVIDWQANGGARQSTSLSEPRRAETPADRGDAAAFRGAERIVSRRVGEEILLFDSGSGLYHVLNETGARVWEGLQKGESVQSIAAAFAADYDVDRERAAADVREVVAHLQEARLVE